MRINLLSLPAALVLVVGLGASSQATVITLTSGQAGGGLVINPSQIVAAVDVFGGQGNTNVVQGETFTTSNSHVSILQSTGGQVDDNNGGNPIGSFDGSANSSDVALTNIDRSINYGAQTITISQLHAGEVYNLQLLTSDGSYNERAFDLAINGVHTDTVDVKVGQSYNVVNNATADINGQITLVMTPNFTAPGGGDPYPTLAGLVVSTPEPGSLVLAGLGAVGLLIAARRRRKA